MMENRDEEDLEGEYGQAQLGSVDSAGGKVTLLGMPGLLESVTISPDGKQILVTREHRPFSYLHPSREFPKEVEVWNQSGAVVRKVASLPLPERVPIGGVQPGPRLYRWMPTEPATILWVEALDGGNPKEDVPHRDRMLGLRAPFNGQPIEVFKTEERFQGIQFGKDFALIEDSARVSRIVRTFKIDPSQSTSPANITCSRKQKDP